MLGVNTLWRCSKHLLAEHGPLIHYYELWSGAESKWNYTKWRIEGQEFWLMDCMALSAVFNSISVILWWPVHLSMLLWSSFNQYFAQYSSQATGCFPTWSLLKHWTGEKEKWMLSQWWSLILGENIGWTAGLNKRPPVVKACMLLNDLQGER